MFLLLCIFYVCFFFFSSRRRHTRCSRDWSSDVCSSDLRALSHWRANEPWLPDRRRWLCSLGLVRAPGEQRSEPGQDAPTFPPLLRQCRKPTPPLRGTDRKSTRLNSSHGYISYAGFCLKKKKNKH